jgi:hypothetical protein
LKIDFDLKHRKVKIEIDADESLYEEALWSEIKKQTIKHYQKMKEEQQRRIDNSYDYR